MKARWKANWFQSAASCGILVAAALAFATVGFAKGRTIGQTGTLTATSAEALGYSVASANTANGMVVVVGAPDANSGYGAAYVYVEPTGGWSGALTNPTILTPQTPVQNSGFGTSVAINNVGTIVVGAPGSATVSSAVYVFENSSNLGWTNGGTAHTGPTFTDSTLGEMFGISVGISATNSNGAYPTVVVGADQAASTDGAAYVYTDSSTGWSAAATISDPNTGVAAGDLFGDSVAITSDATTVVVGSSGYGTSAGLDTGAAYICTLSGSTWVASPMLSPSTSGAAAFGTSVAIGGTSASSVTAVIGAPSTASGAGAAYVYTNAGSGWSPSPTTEIADPAGLAGDLFGTSVAISGDGTVIAVGAPDAAPSTSAVPTLYEFDAPSHGKNPGSWSGHVGSTTYQLSISSTTTSTTANFGDSAAVAIDSTGTAWDFSGAPGIPPITSSTPLPTSAPPGAVYVFTQ